MTVLLEEPDVLVEEPAAPTLLTSLSSLLAACAFGWIVGNVFSGTLPKVLGLLAAAYGVGVAALSTRSRRPSLVQYAGSAGAFVLAALVVQPVADGVGLATLIQDALRGGGLGQPPVTFDPGWRFLLVVAVALLGVSAAAFALSLERPRAAPAVVLPLVVGAALLQPPGALGGTIVALLLLVASLSVALGSDTGLDLRRLAKGAVALTAVGGLLAGGAQLSFLFPTTSADQTVPPMRPQLPPATPDRVLFTVTSEQPVTWRLGTLDVYRDPAWLTPPYSSARLVPLAGKALVRKTFTATFTIAGATGTVLPELANPIAISGVKATYDPRTQVLRTARLRTGATYTVTAPLPPSGAELTAAPPPGPDLREFLQTPTAPSAVTDLLAAAPANPFARLQFVRRAYYAKVVAAGAGKPVDVAPARVAEILAGSPATPYEITAGEALLARWAGVPARIGYGYFGGQPTGDTVEVRPRNGATWLEVYFTGYGWVPIVGTPPRARVSLSTEEQKGDPSVQASDELALVTYVPVRLQTVQLVYVLVRYYALAALPFLLGGLVLLLGYPATLRTLRRSRRARAAGRLGPAARIAAAYAEVRDTATDLAIGHPALSPLEFCDSVEDDAEHRELAWLVTRALWGDLKRDLTEADVAAARELSGSVARRLRTAQPGFDRAAAFVSRASLASPWTRELPALWPTRARWFWPPRPAVVLALVALVAATSLTLPALSRQPVPVAGPALPSRLAPATLGSLRLVPEVQAQQAFSHAALVEQGRVFSLRDGAVIQGSVQIAGFVPEIDVRNRRVRSQILAGLGSGRFEPVRLGSLRAFRIRRPEQTLLLAFARDGRSYTLMVTRASFTDPEQVFAQLLAYAHGESASTTTTPDVPLPDPRRGGTP